MTEEPDAAKLSWLHLPVPRLRRVPIPDPGSRDGIRDRDGGRAEVAAGARPARPGRARERKRRMGDRPVDHNGAASSFGNAGQIIHPIGPPVTLQEGQT